MNTQIQSIHFKADSKLKEYIEKKLDKLNKFYDGIIDAQVYLKVENTSLKENKIVEIKINAKHRSFIQTEVAKSFEAATDVAVDALKRQVKRFKDKVEAH
ncbi:MAG: ribosome-associated translation inhibitor RaiA [Bacteroidia bacterium]|nr:ribosome-associated translation inhibitor RaiA [Bacteroidia bacterium]